jgi:hypothetical protein
MDGLMPVTIGDKLVMARTIYESGIVPNSLDSPQKVFIALQVGHELGLDPMVAVNNISAINGKAVLSADLMTALAKKHPSYAGIDVGYSGEGDALTCTVLVKRKFDHGTDETTASFSIAEAKQAGLFDRQKSPWQTYPKRMLKHRATAWAIRDAFSDVLAGLYTETEIQGEDFSEQPRDVTPGPTGGNADMIVEEIRSSIMERINEHRELMTEEEYDQLVENLDKQAGKGAGQLTQFRRFLNTRLAKLRERGPAPGAKAPADPQPEDAEVVEAAPEEFKEKVALGSKKNPFANGKEDLNKAIDNLKDAAEKYPTDDNDEQAELEIY